MHDNPFRQAGDKPDEKAQPLPLGRCLTTVVGIDRYQHHATLTNAVNDANAVLKLLKRCGFEELAGAPSLFNEQATLEALDSLVRDQLPNELKTDDSMVFFFAGHGTTVSREVPDPQDASKTITRRTGYLIPVDAKGDRPGDWLKLDGFLDDISDLPARHVLVILDACESGFALSDKFRRRGDGQAQGPIAELAGRVSRRVITSAMHDQKAMDGGGAGNSLFTETLVEAIENLRADRDGDGYITTTDLFTFVREQVSETADQIYHVKQTPDYGQLPGDGSGELVLSLRGDTYNRLRADETLKVADSIYQLGWLSGDAKRFASAIRHYKTALKLASLGKMPLPAAKLGLGKALLAAGQAAEAASALAELVRDEGETAATEAQFYLGLAHAKQGGYIPATEALRMWHGLHSQSLDAAWVGAYVDWLGRAAHGEAGRKLALLVGINQYRLLQVPQLNGCVNDAQKLMKLALVAHGGFREEDVTVLTDSQATHQRFVKELRRLKESTTPSDMIVVHFSGHSIPTSMPNAFGKNNEENIYLLMHDTNDEPGYLTNGITADELHQLMQDIPAGRKTLILDTHPSERFMELARSEGSYTLILASDSAEIAYEWRIEVAGETVPCGMLTGALYQSLLNANNQMLSYGEWITSAIRITEEASSLYSRRQTPYFSGIRNQCVFGPDDIFLSVFEFSQRQGWPELTLDELTKLYSVFCNGITVPHPLGHAAFGRAFMSKGANDRAIDALQTTVAQAGDALPGNLLSLVRAQFRALRYPEALATLQHYAPLAPPADQAMVAELGGLLEKLAESHKHALLVGIDKYRSPDVPRLKGARNDVDAIKQRLTERWGFQAEDIVELVGAKATRASILAEFERLAAVARREPALFFFAGHGSCDLNKLPTIIPYDGRQADVSDIALEELANLVGKDPTNLVTVLDAGFSPRTPEATDRAIQPDPHMLTGVERFASYDERLACIATMQLGTVTILQSAQVF